MSKGSQLGWTRMMKQQQEDSQNLKSDDVWGAKYKIMSKMYTNQEQLQLPHPHDGLMQQHAVPCTSPRPLDPDRCRPSSIFHVAVHGDQGNPTATSRLLHILRKWRMQCRKPNRPNSVGAHQSPIRSASCSVLNFVPLSCITFSTSSFQLEQHSDHLEDGDYYTDDSHHMNIGSDSHHGDAKRQPSPVRPHHHSPTSPHASGSTCSKHVPTKKSSTEGLSEARDHAASPCERKLRAPARRALSCPKLGSPLRSRTAFADIQEEELECLKANNEGEDDHQRHIINTLRRASSLPSPRIRSKKNPTPKGYLALYVGQERRRFLVKPNVLNHPLFSILLEKAKEEFGFAQKGPLNIPCDVAFFEHIMFLVESNDPSCKNVDHSSFLLRFGSPN